MARAGAIETGQGDLALRGVGSADAAAPPVFADSAALAAAIHDRAAALAEAGAVLRVLSRRSLGASAVPAGAGGALTRAAHAVACALAAWGALVSDPRTAAGIAMAAATAAERPGAPVPELDGRAADGAGAFVVATAAAVRDVARAAAIMGPGTSVAPELDGRAGVAGRESEQSAAAPGGLRLCVDAWRGRDGRGRGSVSCAFTLVIHSVMCAQNLCLMLCGLAARLPEALPHAWRRRRETMPWMRGRSFFSSQPPAA